MKITCIIPSFYPAVVYGGWIFSSLNVYRALAELGTTTFVTTTNDNGKSTLQPNTDHYIKLEDKIFVKYYPQSIRERFSLSLFLNMWKDIRQGDLVRIHGIFSAPTPIGLLYSSILKKKVLLTPHGCLGSWCLADGSKFKKIYLNLLIKPFANKVIWHATSEPEAKEIKLLFPQAHVEVIPNGISVKEFDTINYISKKDLVKKFTNKDINPDFVGISMGRLHRKKGFDILIHAFRKFLNEFPSSVLLVAGEDFGDKAHLQNIINELNLENNVYFVGHISGQDRIDFLANGDIFVLPSHNENFGMVYAEAMAAGTPIVASTGTPWKEVEELNIGKWVDNNSDSFGEAMIEMARSDYHSKGKASRDFIVKNYSWEGVAKKFEVLLKKVTSKN